MIGPTPDSFRLTKPSNGEDKGTMPNIYEQLGREGGIRKAVDAFYMSVVTDAQLAHYFVGVDMTVIRRHTTALLVTVTGGPSNYAGRDLGLAHAHLGITSADFMRVVGHLVRILEAAKLGSASIDAVVGALAAHQAEIVTADPSGNERARDEYGR
jgi:hemoglobin